MTSTSWLQQSELDAIQHLDRTTPFVIGNVSHSMFSVARHFGGAKYNGVHYTYIPATDELIRDDVLKAVAKLRKPAAKRKKARP